MSDKNSTLANSVEAEILAQILKKPSPKSKLYNHYGISEPNYMHQIDILFLPEDLVLQGTSGVGQKYKYVLCLVDVASRYKAARALKTKGATEVLNALKNIYEADPHLKIPQNINSDSGGEFNNRQFRTWVDHNRIRFTVNKPSFHTPMVDNFIKQLTIMLFKNQQMAELTTGKTNREWYSGLQESVEKLNNTKTSLIGLKPIDAIKLKSVKQKKNEHSEADQKKEILIGTYVRRLLNKDEYLDIATNKIKVERRRATDPYWTLDLYEVVSSIKMPGALMMHTIRNIKTGEIFPHKFTYWQLQPILPNPVKTGLDNSDRTPKS